MRNLRALTSVGALFAVLAFLGGGACGDVEPETRPVEDAGTDGGEADAGEDAGFDAGNPDFECDVAAQDCPAGTTCLQYLKPPANTYATACLPGECGLVAQDCDGGLKCTYTLDAGTAVRACVEDGTAIEGESCTGTPTSNTCRAGLICVPRVQFDGGVEPRCMRFCNDSAQCAQGEACYLTIAPQNSSERPLVCERPCNLFTQDCPPNQACYPGPVVPGCYTAGGNPLGSGCTFSDECVPGAACVGGTCTAVCMYPAGTPGCSGGMCTPLNVPGTSDAGVCL